MRLGSMRTFFAVVLLVLSILHGSVGQECTADGKICDTHERCQAWEEEGECIRALKYMNKVCPASCRGALDEYTRAECKDMHQHCRLWAEIGECQEKYNAANMKKYCSKACGICGDDEGENDESGCEDSHANCGFWAENGEW